MKVKILTLVALVLFGASAFADNCASRLMPTFTSDQANSLCRKLAFPAATGVQIRGLSLDATAKTVLSVASGNVTQLQGWDTSSINFYTNGAVRWNLGTTGDLTNDATSGGDLVLSRTGKTISVQEATAASACMGIATPNGTTNVTVTTSCAVSGARIFYTRVGAVTNMASISTTTAPNGTSFTFASTGATDTLASSVVYWIIKESA